jgi:hypothetical protein
MKMGLTLAMAVLLSSAGTAQASIADCKNLYVVSIHFRVDDTRPQVVFSESPAGGAGVQTAAGLPGPGLTDRAYDQLFSALLTAKSTRSPVDVLAGGTGLCNLGAEYLTGITIK